MSRIGGDYEDTLPHSSKLDSQTTARQMTQGSVQQEVAILDRVELRRGRLMSTTLLPEGWQYLCLCSMGNQITLTETRQHKWSKMFSVPILIGYIMYTKQ